MAVVHVTLDYGTAGLPVELPDRNVCAVLGLAPQAPLTDPELAVRAALAAPIGAPPLAALARGQRSACVAISDVTRPVPNRVLLPPILATLAASGIPRSGIRILVATGTHRGNTPDELTAMVGADVVRDYRVENHDARDRATGHPLDLTYYQVVKGMAGALPAVKPGGTIVIAARCAEGIGGAEFTRTLLETADLGVFVARTRTPDFFVPDQWEVHELAKVVAKAEVLCFTEGIPPATLARCFVTPIASVEEGVRRALARHGAGARVAVIPKGPYVIPVAGAHPTG